VHRQRILLVGLLALAGFAAALLTSSGAASAATTTVQVGDLWFCSSSFNGAVCETTITAGDTVVWNFAGAQNSHTVTECGADCNSATATPLFNSGLIADGSTFQFQFTNAGTYLYFCRVHPLDMRGRIVVQAAAAPTAGGTTPLAGATSTPVLSTHREIGGGLPPTGYGPERQANDAWWLFAAMGAAGLLLTASGAFALRRATR
jgi:plastocyanin